MVTDKFPNGLIGLNPNGLIGLRTIRRGYHSPIFPIFPIFPINFTSISEINFLLEGVRLGLSQK